MTVSSSLPSDDTQRLLPVGCTAMTMGISPTGNRATTRRASTSITEMSWLAVLLTKASLPLGVSTTEKGESPMPSVISPTTS